MPCDCGVGEGFGVGFGEGSGVGFGVGVGMGDGVGVGLGVGGITCLVETKYAPAPTSATTIITSIILINFFELIGVF